MNRSLQSKFLCHFAVEIFFFDALFFLPSLFPFYECDSYFYEISLAIDLHGNEGGSHFFCFYSKFHDLFFLHQKFSISFWVEYFCGSISEVVVTDMHTSDDWTTRCDEYIGSFQIGTTISYALDLFADESYPSFVFFDDFIVKMSLFIVGKYDGRLIFFHVVYSMEKMKKWKNFFPKGI